MNKIPVFDTSETLLPTKKETNKIVKRKLHQNGIRDVPEFPVDKYNIHNPEEVQEWLDEHSIDTDAEKLSLAYEGGARRYLQRKDIVDTFEKLNEKYGPIGFISDISLDGKEFYEGIFLSEDEDEEDLEYKGFVVSDEEEGEETGLGMFERFLELRDEPAEDFVFFSNNAELGRKAIEHGMNFVWVKRYDTFDTEHDGVSMGAVNMRNVEKALEKVGESES